MHCIITLFLLLAARTICNDAKKIDSYDLLIGDWDTSLRLSVSSSYPPNKLLDIFSSTTSTDTTHPSSVNDGPSDIRRRRQQHQLYGWFNPSKLRNSHRNSNDNNNNEGQGRRQQQHKKTFDSSKSIPCRLSLYANGTFGMMVANPNPNNNSSSNSIDNDDETTTAMTTRPDGVMMTIRGKWAVQTNPYCVTDRFYDNVVLESYPRIRKEQLRNVTRQRSTKDQRNNTNDDIICVTKNNIRPLEAVQLKLRCRLSGHFTSRKGDRRRRQQNDDENVSRRKYYARGTMTHGTMVLEELYNCMEESDDRNRATPLGGMMKTSWLMQQYRGRYKRHKKIIASFTGRRYIPTNADLASQSNDNDDIDVL